MVQRNAMSTAARVARAAARECAMAFEARQPGGHSDAVRHGYALADK